MSRNGEPTSQRNFRGQLIQELKNKKEKYQALAEQKLQCDTANQKWIEVGKTECRHIEDKWKAKMEAK